MLTRLPLSELHFDSLSVTGNGLKLEVKLDGFWLDRI